jgi:hypothetical protein
MNNEPLTTQSNETPTSPTECDVARAEPRPTEPTYSGVANAESVEPVTLAGVSEPTQDTTLSPEDALRDGRASLDAEQGKPTLEERVRAMVTSVGEKLKARIEENNIGPQPWKFLYSRVAPEGRGASVLEAHEVDGVGCLVRSRTMAGNSISEALVLVPGVECKPRSNDPKDGHELLPIGFKP